MTCQKTEEKTTKHEEPAAKGKKRAEKGDRSQTNNEHKLSACERRRARYELAPAAARPARPPEAASA